MKNYYEILEVNENASKEVIDKAYKVLAKKYHPDLQEEKNKKVAEEKIKSLNEAYEILSNPKKKQAYDAKIARLKQEEENRKQVEHQNYVNNISNVYARQYTNIQRDRTKALLPWLYLFSYHSELVHSRNSTKIFCLKLLLLDYLQLQFCHRYHRPHNPNRLNNLQF